MLIRRIACALVLLGVVNAHAQVQDPQILVVPYAPEDLRLPYPAHEGARITLKAVLRNANCAQGYEVQWDTNRNQQFDEAARVVTPSGGKVYDIGQTHTVGPVANDTSTPINLRVRNRCSGDFAFATYRLFTYNWSPNNDPRQWSDDEIDIMAQIALHEALWYIHRKVGNRGGRGRRSRP